MKSIVTVTLGLAIVGTICLLQGCVKTSNSVGLVAPEKPLSQPQKQLLDQINALPQDQRKDFVMKHGREIMQFSSKNKKFGDAMNAALAIAPAKQ
jgi:outer membrane murein-binding lipoprotein Lpp